MLLEPPGHIGFDGVVPRAVGELTIPGEADRGAGTQCQIEADFGDQRIARDR